MNSPLNASSVAANPLENSSSILRFQGQCIASEISRKGRLKSVSLQLTDTVISLDIPKVLGHSLRHQLQMGSGLQAWVRPQKNSFKALMIVPEREDLPPMITSWAEAVPILRSINDRSVPLIPSEPSLLTSSASAAKPVKSKPIKLQVCTKGSCRKRGSLDLLKGLTAQVNDRGCEHQIQIEPVGCLKLCKKAPNVCLFPSGKRISPPDLQDITALLPNLG